MTRHAVYMLLVCTGVAPSHPLMTNTTVALVAHFERSSGQRVLHWIGPMIAQVFRPAGLSLEWYTSPDDVPANAARTLAVWFHGDCWPMAAPEFQGLLRTPVRLGWVLSHDGHIGADIEVDCALVMRVAAEAQSGTNGALPCAAFLRLMERVVSHELMHVLLMSPGHGTSDCTRAHLQPSEWRRIGRLTHAEVDLLRKLYRPEALVVWAPTR